MLHNFISAILMYYITGHRCYHQHFNWFNTCHSLYLVGKKLTKMEITLHAKDINKE